MAFSGKCIVKFSELIDDAPMTQISCVEDIILVREDSMKRSLTKYR